MKSLSALSVALDKTPRPGDGEVTYGHIFENDYLTMGVFLMKKGTKIPLHDHPDMYVLSKVIYGSIRLVAYDVVIPVQSNRQVSCSEYLTNKSLLQGYTRLCHKTVDMVLKEGDIHTTKPMDGGNFHEIEALEDTAFVDIMSPPYDNYRGRECFYYEAIDADADQDAVERLLAYDACRIPAETDRTSLKWLCRVSTNFHIKMLEDYRPPHIDLEFS
eukprot:Colp12_sorted_trinity150504_noHs@30152